MKGGRNAPEVTGNEPEVDGNELETTGNEFEADSIIDSRCSTLKFAQSRSIIS